MSKCICDILKLSLVVINYSLILGVKGGDSSERKSFNSENGDENAC